MFVRVDVLVGDGPIVLVAVRVEVAVGVGVRVGVTEMVGVSVLLGVGVTLGVMEGVFVETGPVDRKLNASTSLADKFQVLPSKYKAAE